MISMLVAGGMVRVSRRIGTAFEMLRIGNVVLITTGLARTGVGGRRIPGNRVRLMPARMFPVNRIGGAVPIGPVPLLMARSGVFLRRGQRRREQQPDQCHKKGGQQAQGRQAEFEAFSCHGIHVKQDRCRDQGKHPSSLMREFLQAEGQSRLRAEANLFHFGNNRQCCAGAVNHGA